MCVCVSARYCSVSQRCLKTLLMCFRCETEIDECEPSPCLNGATCLDRLNHFQCVCVPGFSGTLCESNVSDGQIFAPTTVLSSFSFTAHVLNYNLNLGDGLKSVALIQDF